MGHLRASEAEPCGWIFSNIYTPYIQTPSCRHDKRFLPISFSSVWRSQMWLIFHWLVLLGAVNLCSSARILAVLPFPARSHFLFFSPILKGLAERGHQVVEYSPCPPDPDKPATNYTHHLINTLPKTSHWWTYDEFIDNHNIMRQKNNYLGMRGKVLGYNNKKIVCDTAFKTDELKNLLRSNEQFDIVMTESTFGQESINVFGHKFKAPVVALQTFHVDASINMPAGNALSIATIPFTNTEASDNMTFMERLCNFLSTTMLLIAYYNYHLPMQEKIIREHYDQETPPIEEMVTNISLYLLNVHPTAQYSQPFPPNMIPVGGIAISDKRKLLPQDIQNFMDTAEKGVIHFSLGTVVPVELFPEKIINIFLAVFSKLNYKVLCKISSDTLPVRLPNNVKVTKWVPQLGVLTHPKCVLFVTHGGLLGQQEAVYAGVPTVTISFISDQYLNAKFYEERQIGVKLYFKDLSEDTFYSAITTVLNNSMYKDNAVRLSRVFRDLPQSPLDTALFWVEYVLRHRGAPHLRPAASRLCWYQLALLDITSAILSAAVCTATLLYYLVMKINALLLKEKGTVRIKKKTKYI